MTKKSILTGAILFTEIAGHGEKHKRYKHNQTPILLIAYTHNDQTYYRLLTGGTRYNSATDKGYEYIDAYVINANKIDFSEHTINYLWETNDEDEIIELLGIENFD